MSQENVEFVLASYEWGNRERRHERYPDVEVRPLEARANGNRVFVWVRFIGEGGTSGIPLDMRLAHVITIEGGRIRRLEEYFDRSEALQAVGVSE